MVLGMGSPSDKKAFEQVRLDGKTIDKYFNERGIKIYHHPEDGGYLTTSIHRTTQDTIDYANNIRMLPQLKNNVVSVFYGGLAFALPGVFAAEAPTTPVIGVGSDIDAFYNVYKIPDGTPVGVVEINNLEKGLLLAEKILNLEPTSSINLKVHGDCKSADDVKKLLQGFVGDIQEIEDDTEVYKGLTVCLSDNIKSLIDFDKRVELGIFGIEKTYRSIRMIEPLKEIENSIVIGRPKNLALYAARILGLNNEKIGEKLIKFRKEEAEKYPDREFIKPEDFR